MLTDLQNTLWLSKRGGGAKKMRINSASVTLHLWVTLLQQGVGLGDPQRALPTPTIL